MNGFLSSIALLLVFASAAAQAAPAKAPHDLAPRLESQSDGDATDSDAGTGYEEAPPVPVSVEAVEKPSTDNFGILDENHGGLPASVWKGSTRETLDPLLMQVTGVASAPIRNVLIRLLMTASPPPQGHSGEDWLTLRLNALMNLGQEDKVSQMVSGLPTSLITSPMLETEIEVELAHGDYDKACAKMQPNINSLNAKDTIFWQKFHIICQIKGGKSDEAMVGLDVLNETDATTTFFQDEVRHITNKNIPVKSSPSSFSLLDFTLMRMAGDNERLKDKIDVLPALAIKYLALDETADVKLREKALARARQLGILPMAENGRLPEQPFEKSLASDVITLVSALGSGNTPNDADNAVIARLPLDEAGIQDSRRIERLLTLMDIFGYKVPPMVWQKLFAHKNRFDGEVPPALRVGQLSEAANANRKGEVIVLAALAADGNDTDKMSDLTLVPLVKGLKSMGFDKEARELAYSAVKTYH